jgi:predicted adenine nucleotide alpha hydrolase (AANH) superfamily ATPase
MIDDIHEVWGFAKDNPELCSEGYDKHALQHVQFWFDEFKKQKSLREIDEINNKLNQQR